MKLSNETIEALSEKFSRLFTLRMPSSAHLRADLKQEAAIAIVMHAPRWRTNGGANLETFVRIYAWRAMQVFCSKQSGPVSKPTDANGNYEGTSYGIGYEDKAGFDTPETIAERRDADAILRDFVNRRTAQFTGNGKLTVQNAKNAMQDLLSGDSCQEVGARYGVSKQYISKLAAKAEIA